MAGPCLRLDLPKFDRGCIVGGYTAIRIRCVCGHRQ